MTALLPTDIASLVTGSGLGPKTPLEIWNSEGTGAPVDNTHFIGFGPDDKNPTYIDLGDDTGTERRPLAGMFSRVVVVKKPNPNPKIQLFLMQGTDATRGQTKSATA
jgi:hypothetical protein